MMQLNECYWRKERVINVTNEFLSNSDIDSHARRFVWNEKPNLLTSPKDV